MLHPDFGELAGAAGLLFVAVFGIGRGFDRFTEWNAGFAQLDMGVESAFQAVHQHIQVQFALGGNDRLVQFRIDAIDKSGVFLMQRRQAGRDLVFLALGGAVQRGMNGGLRILHLHQFDRPRRGAQGVARMRVLQLHHRANIAPGQFLHHGAILSVENIKLADALDHAAISVKKFHARLEAPGINAEKGKLAEVRLGHRLENVGDRLRVGQPDLRRRAAAVHGGVAFAINRRGTVFGDEIHQARHTNIGLGRRAEERNKMLLLHGGMYAGAKLLFRQPAFVQVFRQQRIIRFGDVFDQFAMQFGHFILPFARGRDLA